MAWGGVMGSIDHGKFKAFFVHLVVSVLILLGVLFLVFGVWYPAPLHKILGVAGVFLLLVLVDLVLGPVLTFLVYKKGKKGLVLDLVVVISLQFAVLGYGLFVLAVGRPAWIVFEDDRFIVVRALDLDEEVMVGASPEFRNTSWLGPGWAALAAPETIEEKNASLFESVFGVSGFSTRPEMYVPVESVFGAITTAAHPVAQLSLYNDSDKLSRIFDSRPTATHWLPVVGRSGSVVVLLDGEHVLGLADLAPWSPD